MELLVGGAGLECVGGGEVTAFGFQVGTHLNAKRRVGVREVLRRQYVNNKAVGLTDDALG